MAFLHSRHASSTWPPLEKINVDRFTKIPDAFGDGEFWKKYSELAIKDDATTTKRLTAELDILLLFAGLFCGINTAFIGFTIPMLSAGPSDETNNLLRLLVMKNGTINPEDLAPPPFSPTWDAVRVNLLFAASLSCSLLAAFGAMLGKEWLSYADETTLGRALRDLRGQGQQLRRDEPGAKRWHFHSTIEALPLVLEAGLFIFWLGLLDFLWFLHRVVACVALGLAAAGFAFQILTIVAAATDPDCPFRTPLSIKFIPRVIKLAPQILLSTLIAILTTVLVPITLAFAIVAYIALLVTGIIGGFLFLITFPVFYVMKMSGLGSILWDVFSDALTAAFNLVTSGLIFLPVKIYTLWRKSVTWTQGDAAADTTSAEAVRWLLTQPDPEAPLLAAWHIPTLNDDASINCLTIPRESCNRLSAQFRTQMIEYQLLNPNPSSGKTANDGKADDVAWPAIVYGRALCHLLLAPEIPVKASIDWAGASPVVGDCVAGLKRVSVGRYPELDLLKLLLDDASSSPPKLDILDDIDVSILPIYLATSMTSFHSGSKQLRQQRIKKVTEDLEDLHITGFKGHRDTIWDRFKKESSMNSQLAGLHRGFAFLDDVSPVWRWNRMMIVKTLSLKILASERKPPRVLNLILWAMAEICRDEKTSEEYIDEDWISNRWKAYSSAAREDVNLVSSLASALRAYKQHIDTAPDERKYWISKDVTTVPFRKIYAGVLSAVQDLYKLDDNKGDDELISELDEPLYEQWPGLLSATNDALGLESVGPYDPQHEDVTDREDQLLMRKELIQTMKTFFLRLKSQARTSKAQLRLVRKLWEVTQVTGPNPPEQPLDVHMALLEMIQHCDLSARVQEDLFDSNPTSARAFCSGLVCDSSQIRIQALRTIAAQSKAWLSSEIAQKLFDAGLTPLLAECVAKDDWSTVAPFIATIVRALSTPGARQGVTQAFAKEMENADASGQIRLSGSALYLWYKQSKPKDPEPSGSEPKQNTVAPAADALSSLIEYVITHHADAPEAIKAIHEGDHRATLEALRADVPEEGQPFLRALESYAKLG